MTTVSWLGSVLTRDSAFLRWCAAIGIAVALGVAMNTLSITKIVVSIGKYTTGEYTDHLSLQAAYAEARTLAMYAGSADRVTLHFSDGDVKTLAEIQA